MASTTINVVAGSSKISTPWALLICFNLLMIVLVVVYLISGDNVLNSSGTLSGPAAVSSSDWIIDTLRSNGSEKAGFSQRDDTVESRLAHEQLCRSPAAVQLFLTDASLLDCAVRIARQDERTSQRQSWTSTKLWEKNSAPLKPRIAFLFITRDDIPHEPLWQRFFGINDSNHQFHDLYSVYVHSRPGLEYAPGSFFHSRQIPSAPVARRSMTLVDAMRRLLAYSLLDPAYGAANAWFIYVCERTIPLRSFQYTYDFLTQSQRSFVDSFFPISRHNNWHTEPEFPRESMRKGEVWMALQRRHAIVVLEDWTLYFKFKSHCKSFCTPDEQYFQTLLGLQDPGGISNWTVMYVNWTEPHGSSPNMLDLGILTPRWLKDIRGRRVQTDGMFHDTSAVAEASETKHAVLNCVYNGRNNLRPCYLFARKVDKKITNYLLDLPPAVLGY